MEQEHTSMIFTFKAGPRCNLSSDKRLQYLCSNGANKRRPNPPKGGGSSNRLIAAGPSKRQGVARLGM